MSLDDLEHIKNMDFEFLHVGDLTIVGPAYQQLLKFLGKKHTRAIEALLELSADLEVYELSNFEDGDAWITTCLYKGFGFKVMFIRSRFYIVRIYEGIHNHETPVIMHGIVVSTRGQKPRVSCLEGCGAVVSRLPVADPIASNTAWVWVSYRLSINTEFNLAVDALAYDGESDPTVPGNNTGAIIWCDRLLADDAVADPRRADARTDNDAGAALSACALSDAVLDLRNGWAITSSWFPKGIQIDATIDDSGGSTVPGNNASAIIWCDQLLTSEGWSTKGIDLS
ncbi:MAG: hypothetical protein AAFR75_00895 [Pseudomonadota bacterium]